MQSFELKNIISHFTGQANTIACPAIFRKFLGNYNRAILFSQMLYWDARTSDADGWFHKSNKEWQKEIYLTEKEIRNSIDYLKEKHLIETKVWKVNGTPKLHFRVKSQQFEKKFLNFLKSLNSSQVDENKGASPNARRGKSDMPGGASPISSPKTTVPETTFSLSPARKKTSGEIADETFGAGGDLDDGEGFVIEGLKKRLGTPVHLPDHFAWHTIRDRVVENGYSEQHFLMIYDLLEQVRKKKRASWTITPEMVERNAGKKNQLNEEIISLENGDKNKNGRKQNGTNNAGSGKDSANTVARIRGRVGKGSN